MKTKDEKLQEAAEKHFKDNGKYIGTKDSSTYKYNIDLFIDIIKSEAAKAYHTQTVQPTNIVVTDEFTDSLTNIERIADSMQNNSNHLTTCDFNVFGVGSQKIMKLIGFIRSLEFQQNNEAELLKYKELDECNKCTIYNLKQTISDLKSAMIIGTELNESLKFESDNLIDIDYKIEEHE